MKVVPYERTDTMNVQTKDYRAVVRNYFGRVTTIHDGAQVFMSEMPDPGSVIDPHFHDVDEFQVIVRGGGRFGGAPVDGIIYHYADAYAPYGPIIAGEQGLDFITFRASCTTGYFPMPESRAKIPGKPGRNLNGRFDLDKPLPSAGAVERETLLSDAKDGMLITGLRLGANARTTGDATSAGQQYYLVCSGSLLAEEGPIPVKGLIQVQPGEAPATLQAGPDGAHVLFMQLPRPSERPGSYPRTMAELKGASYSYEGLTTSQS
jgi:hypothetical protein